MLKFKSRRPKDFYASGEEVEARGYETLGKIADRAIRGLFVFKTRKGEIVAASSTFFILMSFLPIMLITISIYGQVVGDVTLAHQHVMNLLQENVPGLAPWIFSSLDKIVANHLNQASGVNWLSALVLCYAVMGYSSSLIFGMTTLAAQHSRGGKFFEDSRAFFGALGICLFMFGFAMLNVDFGFWAKQSDGAWWGKLMVFMLRYNILQVGSALVFFSAFYKSFIPGKIRNIDAVLGAASFVALFLLGKSFYWVYIHMAKAELAATFGNFETIVMAVTWVYFIQSSFFFGASVACAPMSLRKQKQMEQQLPPMPQAPVKIDDDVA